LHQLLLPSSSFSLKIFNLQKDAARLTSLEEARTLADCSSTAMLSTISQVRILSLFQQAFYRKIG
jgi:hypothetical protein